MAASRPVLPGSGPWPAWPRWPAAFFGTLAVALLAGTLAWHIPMMLWDHLDLVPMLDASQRPGIDYRHLLEIHQGSHLHATAYLVLLATTELSGGRTWLDCLVSWSLLVAFALVVLWTGKRVVGGGGTWAFAVIFFALYPGHLANLQWGWQVAVFLCLLGVALTIAALTRPRLTWPLNLAALLATGFAVLGFSTGIAVIPAALLSILLRTEQPMRARVALVVPWLVLLAVLVRHLATGVQGFGVGELPSLILYMFNFLGAGVSRFATDAAAVFAVLACVSIAPVAWRLRHCPRARPWLAWLAFACAAALLTALGRVGVHGSDQAFASRYVSFSSTFWLGWCGLVATARSGAASPAGATTPRRMLHPLLASLFVLAAAFNAVHMARNARTLGAATLATAREIGATYPEVDEQLLRAIYFDDPQTARARLDMLHAASAAPFAGND